MRAKRCVGLCLAAFVSAATTVSAAPLPHEAYIWQRAWRPAVSAAVTSAAPRLAGFVILAAELGPTGIVRPAPDYQALAATGRPIGLALRIGARTATDSVPTLAAQLLADAASNHMAVSELQLDYDCPESKLGAYRELVVAVRRRIAPQRLTITALPAWLRQPAFQGLVAATDGFVLQVHALDAGLGLCDRAAARAAVARANRCGRPFRVALPTHAYVVGVNPNGKLMGVQAEGPPPSWPPDVTLRDVRADPIELAGLVGEWNRNPPSHLTGIIWYRLPVTDDRLNWRWATLAAIVDGRVPQPSLTLAVRQPQPGLVELDLANQGEADATADITVGVTWRDAALLACDALVGFARSERAPDATATRFAGNPRLAPGESRTIAWLRFRNAEEIHCEARLE